MTKADQETARLFAARYQVAPAEVSRQVELAVIGGDWGANGYTTMAQAGILAERRISGLARHRHDMRLRPIDR